MRYSNIDLGRLIEDITPSYNFYRENHTSLKGNESIEIMRDIGAFLEGFIDKYDVKPHYLFRDIYGKGEGKVNTLQKSYITREFLGRCYRIKKIFAKKSDIKKELPTLVSFSAFRECMPFFDNPKYTLKGEDKEYLLNLLNGKVNGSNVLGIIRDLQSKKIGIKNSRTQRHNEVNKELFVKVYDYLRNLLKTDYSNIENILNEDGVCIDSIQTLSNNLLALTNPNLHINKCEVSNEYKEPRKEFIEYINVLADEGTKITKRNRNRNVIGDKILILLADMLTALTSKGNYDSFCIKYNIKN